MKLSYPLTPPSKKAAKRARSKGIKQAALERKQANQLTPEGIVRFEKRKAVVEAVQRGEAVALVARVHGISERNAFRWVARHASKGLPGLRDEVRSGRPAKVSPEAMQWLYQSITGGNPRQFQFAFALWTLAIIRAVLLSEKNISLSKSSICRLMAQMGITPQVPVYKSYRQSPGKVRYYLKARYPKLAQWAQEQGAEIFFEDESRVRVDAHQGTTWAACGETPTVRDSGDRFGVNMISAVSARGEMFFECFDDTMNSARFIAFLKALRASAQRPILVIVDGGSYHKSKEVKAFERGEGVALGIKVALLPPYSPELNPDEQVWNQAKRSLGKQILTTKRQLLDAVKSTLSAIQAAWTLVQSFFQLKHTLYASGLASN